MRLIYAVFILLLALMTSAQCQQTAAPIWMDLMAVEQGDGHALHIMLYDADENIVTSDGELSLTYLPTIIGYDVRSWDEMVKNETIQVTKSMFKNGMLKLPRIRDFDLIGGTRYEVNMIGGRKIEVPADGIEIIATFKLPSNEVLRDTDWWGAAP